MFQQMNYPYKNKSRQKYTDIIFFTLWGNPSLSFVIMTMFVKIYPINLMIVKLLLSLKLSLLGLRKHIESNKNTLYINTLILIKRVK